MKVKFSIDLRDVLLEVEAGVALTSARHGAAEAGYAGDRDGRTGAGIGIRDRLLMTMGVLEAEFVQLVGSERATS